ncbi:MAG: 50S ribosomal protein L27 [Candidatus Moraniibacteriota bacterium]
MAHKKAGGTTSLGRDSISKRLGVKIYGGQFAEAGNVIIRQRGTKYHLGKNMKKGADDTLYALVNGIVEFKTRKVREFTGKLVERIFVSIIPKESR